MNPLHMHPGLYGSLHKHHIEYLPLLLLSLSPKISDDEKTEAPPLNSKAYK